MRLLLERSRQHSFDILCYCLMTNHIHLVMVPHQQDSLNKGLRNKTRTGRPWGSEAFIEQMEARLGRPLKPQKAGRPVSKVVPRK